MHVPCFLLGLVAIAAAFVDAISQPLDSGHALMIRTSFTSSRIAARVNSAGEGGPKTDTPPSSVSSMGKESPEQNAKLRQEMSEVEKMMKDPTISFDQKLTAVLAAKAVLGEQV